MNLKEYFERNPGVVERIKAGRYHIETWERTFPELSAVAWSSFITNYLTKTGKAFLAPVRTQIKYLDLTPEDYDEQMAINQKFQRIYCQEKREKALREAAAQYDR